MSTDRCGYPDGQEHPHVEQCHRAEREQVLAQVEALRETLVDEMGAVLLTRFPGWEPWRREELADRLAGVAIRVTQPAEEATP